MKIRYVISTMLLVLLAAGLCDAQLDPIASEKDGITYSRSVPSILLPYQKALGNRMKAEEKELTAYTGRFIDAYGNEKSARVIHQLPNLVRLEGFKDKDAVLAFDGEIANSIASMEQDESLMETFVMDMPEGMLASVQESAAVRLIGRGFGPDSGSGQKESGPRYDIYEITAPVKGLDKEIIRTKKYYFDSDTKLLLSARYYEFSGRERVKVEIRFSSWGTIDGAAYPAQIERYENGKRVFAFVAESIESSVSMDKELFR